jgi:hypothetical protein
LPRALVHLAARVAAVTHLDEAEVTDILLGAPAPHHRIQAVAEALRTLRNDDPTDPDVLLVRGLEPRCVSGPRRTSAAPRGRRARLRAAA